MEHKESFAVGVVFTLLSAVGMSLVGLFGKMGNEIFSLSALIFWRFFAAFLLIALLFWVMGLFKGGMKTSALKMHILRACFVLGAQYCFYYYIQRDSLLNGTMLLSTGPLFIPVFEKLILKKRIGKSSWIALIFSFIGVICILQPDRNIFSFLSLMGLLSGIFQALSQVVFGINSREERSDLGVFYLMFLCALFSFPPYLFEEAMGSGETGTFQWSVLLIVLLGVSSIFNQMMRAVAYQHGTPSRLAVFLYFAVILSGVWDWVFFQNIPNGLSLIGGSLVIFSGILKIYLRGRINKLS